VRLIDHRRRKPDPPPSRAVAVGRYVRLWYDATPGEVVGRHEGTFVVRWSDTGNATRHHAKDLEVV
jgi:hypothetical protein